MKFSFARVKLPTLTNALLAIFSAILLTLAFPNFDLWFLAWFALVPLFYAIEREKESIVKSFVLGWIFGTAFFCGACWWLTFSFITYGGLPTLVAYFLLFIICSMVGFFPAIFGAAFSLILKRCGIYGILSAPFLWTAMEFFRFNLTGNNWNAIGYSQAFSSYLLPTASIGGVYLTGFLLVFFNSLLSLSHSYPKVENKRRFNWIHASLIISFILISSILSFTTNLQTKPFNPTATSNIVVVVQANVPMSGLNEEKWMKLRQRHVELAESAIDSIETKAIEQNLSSLSLSETTREDEKILTETAIQNFEKSPKTIVFPESPMNFMYERDEEFQAFIGDFARKHNAYVLFNSAEPNPKSKNFYNSAIMINPQGEKIGQYDKIHLVPFGEYAPVPSAVEQFVPTLVGNFQYGENYNLFPFGEAKGGIMICYESHFASLSREFARRGADVLIEMTNDGYLGNTGVLRQHLASAVFRAVETNRPVLRATNVGITAYINERGEVLDAADVYTEATRVWTVGKSDGKQTFYVRYGEWFAWFCSLVSLGLLFFSFWKREVNRKNNAESFGS